jgi:predicted esterase
MLSENAKSIPIFWGHGSDDPLVRPEFGTRSVEFLKTQCGISEADGKAPSGLKFKMYPNLEHSSSPEELGDLASWVKSVIPKEEDEET